jgi:hypothetical protein
MFECRKSRVDMDRLDTSRRGFLGMKPPACSGPALEDKPVAQAGY